MFFYKQTRLQQYIHVHILEDNFNLDLVEP